jgi:hypothetical protein
MPLLIYMYVIENNDTPCLLALALCKHSLNNVLTMMLH